MNEVPEVIARWLELKRRRDRISAAVISVLALGSGSAVFLFATLLVYALLCAISGTTFGRGPTPWLVLVSLGFNALFFARIMKSRRCQPDLELDPMGAWIIKDLCSIGPRLILEGLHQVRNYGDLGELNVEACARVLAYLARQNAKVTREELLRHFPQLSWERLSRQLLLLDGVLFLGEDGSRITLMEPFRLLLRSMLGPEPQTARKRPEPIRPKPRSEPAPEPAPVNEPEKLTAYEILGLSASASIVEIKAAYRKRIKACHPDLFAGMDPQARALAERWTKALNAAYATLNPRNRGAKRN